MMNFVRKTDVLLVAGIIAFFALFFGFSDIASAAVYYLEDLVSYRTYDQIVSQNDDLVIIKTKNQEDKGPNVYEPPMPPLSFDVDPILKAHPQVAFVMRALLPSLGYYLDENQMWVHRPWGWGWGWTPNMTIVHVNTKQGSEQVTGTVTFTFTEGQHTGVAQFDLTRTVNGVTFVLQKTVPFKRGFEEEMITFSDWQMVGFGPFFFQH